MGSHLKRETKTFGVFMCLTMKSQCTTLMFLHFKRIKLARKQETSNRSHSLFLWYTKHWITHTHTHTHQYTIHGHTRWKYTWYESCVLMLFWSDYVNENAQHGIWNLCLWNRAQHSDNFLLLKITHHTLGTVYWLQTAYGQNKRTNKQQVWATFTCPCNDDTCKLVH